MKRVIGKSWFPLMVTKRFGPPDFVKNVTIEAQVIEVWRYHTYDDQLLIAFQAGKAAAVERHPLAKTDEKSNAAAEPSPRLDRLKTAAKVVGAIALVAAGAYVIKEMAENAGPSGTPIIIAGANTSSSTAIQSRIEGTFEGWSGDTIFKLANGQIWQQAAYAYYYNYKFNPKVIIVRDGAEWVMHVDGVNRSIAVRQLN